ncbi:MAG: peroxidase family protein [Saprospiraceae bacterium]
MKYFNLLIICLLVLCWGQVSATGSTTNSIEYEENFSTSSESFIPISESSTTAYNCSVTANNCTITLTGLTPSDHPRIFDVGWQMVWNCNPWENGGCNPTETITGLENGVYYVLGCGGQTTTITITDCGNVDPCANLGGDTDNDGVCDNQDNCPTTMNSDQMDSDGDGIGDVCDTHNNPCANLGGDTDNDGVCDNQDNCPTTMNSDQMDSDGDGIGDVCDTPNPTGCSNPSNLALNKLTTQSSTLSAGGITGSASKAVDGNTNGVFFTGNNNTSSVAATTNEFQGYWEVDLGEEFNLEEVRIWNRTDGQDKTKDCYLLISSNPFSSGNLNTSLDEASFSQYEPGPVGNPSMAMLPVGTTGRYVRIQLQNSGYVVLAEVEVFGCAISGGGTPSITIGDVTVNENAGSANLQLNLSAPSSSVVTVSYSTDNGTATSLNDFTAGSGMVTFPIGSTTASISIPITDDNINEPTESFVVNLTNPSGANIGDTQGTVTINDNDAPGLPSVSINNVTVDEDGGNANFTVTLSTPSTTPVTVSYATANGTAMTPDDYATSTGTVTFQAGMTSATILIPVTDDIVDEPTESFVVNLTNPSGATIATPQGTATINDNDNAPGGCGVTVTTDGCTITINGITDAVANIKVFNPGYNGAAWSCNPWQGSPCNVTETITGLANGTYPVAVLTTDANGQNVCNFNENITIDCTGGITPNVSVLDALVAENNGMATVTFTLNTPGITPISVNYSTTDGTATSPADYIATTGTVVFPVGSTSVTATIPITDNSINEPTESFVVNITNASGATIGNAQGTVTINDNDPANPCFANLDVDTDNDGVCDNDDCQPFNPLFPAVPGTACNDGNANTENDVVTADGCNCMGTIINLCLANGDVDTDGDGVCDNDDCQINDPFYPATPGTTCNDGDANTENDVVTADGCDCEGIAINPCLAAGGIDSDGDGVCDDEDCQPFNGNLPTLPGTPCDDGMANTMNDVIAADGCSCAGQLVNPVCNYILFNEFGFENGYDFWNDGGNSCTLENGKGANGSHVAVELKDNDGHSSSTFTNHMNLTNTQKVQFDFWVRFNSMEHGEDLLLEYSTNGGNNYQVAHQWISGIHIQNSSTFSNIVVEIESSFSNQTVFRFRCDASSGLDKVYLDDIKTSVCNDYNDPFAGQRPTYRTIDGTLNNFDNPEYGTVGQPLFREIPAQYGGDGSGNVLGGQNRPNPRHISNQLSDEPQDRRDERLLSGMAYQFGQFLDHDIVISETGNEFTPIISPSYDPVFGPNALIPFNRSTPIAGSSPRQQPNGLSSYIDASNVYSADPVRAAWLRTFQDGKLKTSKGNQLPYNTIDGEFDSPVDLDAPRMERDETQAGVRRVLAVVGDFRGNEHPNLTAFHLLFVREHNRLCDYLISQGETDDEIIYQKARKLVGAMMQRIVYKEFIPAFGVSLNSYTGYDSNVRPDVRNTFATAAYRWHTMVENDIILRNDNCEGIGVVELPLKTIFSNPNIIQQYGPGVLLRGLAFHPQYRTDLKVNNGLRNFLFGQGAGLDLVSINLQRGRDHGLPDYKTVRSYYGGSHISSFSNINSDHEISSRLQSVYGNVNDIDLWAGIFAEPLVSGTSLPATAIAILKKQFEVLRDGDFYYYQNDPFLTNSDRSIIESSDLASIIERNTSARSMPSNIFFKPPCDASEPLEDTRDEGNPVCNGSGATFFTSCSSTSGSSKNVGTYFNTNISKIKVNLGYSVRIYNNQGESTYYTDDTGCLPTEFSNGSISSIDVICLSDDPSTIDCTGFAGALFDDCFSSPLPIFTTGSYTQEQLKSLSVEDDFVSAIRVNNGFQVTLFEHDNFQGASWTYVGPTVLCLPSHENNKTSSMKVICLSDPDRSNCGFNGVAGAIFQKGELDENSHIGVSVGEGDYNMARLIAMGAGNDNTKQIKVNNGYAITLFEDDNFQGNYTVYLGDESDLTTTITETHYPIWDILGLFPYTNTISMDDMTSSMKVRCIESLQNPQGFVVQSDLDFEATREVDDAKLEVNYDLAKNAIYMTIEKYDGRTGDFEYLDAFDVNTNTGSYSYYDENTIPGDNIYRVLVHYADGSEEETPYRTVKFDLSLPFNVFPNPTTDVVNINLEKYEGMDVSISIYDLRGVEIKSKDFENLSQQIVSFDLSNTISGNYLVRVAPHGKRATSQQFTIMKRD